MGNRSCQPHPHQKSRKEHEALINRSMREREEEEEGVTLGRRCVSTAGVVQSKKHCRLDDGDDERPYSSTHLPPAPMAASSSSPLTLTATAAAPNANATNKHTKKPKSARERETKNPPPLCCCCCQDWRGGGGGGRGGDFMRTDARRKRRMREKLGFGLLWLLCFSL